MKLKNRFEIRTSNNFNNLLLNADKILEINNIIKISSNNDWKKLREEEFVVSINNNAYFGYRVLEKKAKMIFYNPFEVDNLKKLLKYGSKFKNTIHLLNFNIDTLSGTLDISEKLILIINMINFIKNYQKIDIILFFNSSSSKNNKIIIKIISSILDYPIGFTQSLDTKKLIEENFVNFIIKDRTICK